MAQGCSDSIGNDYAEIAVICSLLAPRPFTYHMQGEIADDLGADEIAGSPRL
jgi:hypothetical protein